MSWERFHFCCRFATRSLQNGLGIAASFRAANESSMAREFGPPIKSGSLPDFLWRELTARKDGAIKDEAIEKALEIYGQLDFSTFANKSSRLRWIQTYIALLTLVFLGMSAIYHLLVTPALRDFYESYGTRIPSGFGFFAENWEAVSIAISGVVLLSFLVSRRIDQLSRFDVASTHPTRYSFLVPSRIAKLHRRITSLLQLPLDVSGVRDRPVEGLLSDHFRKNAYSNSEIAREISILVSHNLRLFVRCSLLFLQLLISGIGLLVIIAISLLLGGAYTSMISMGYGL